MKAVTRRAFFIVASFNCLPLEIQGFLNPKAKSKDWRDNTCVYEVMTINVYSEDIISKNPKMSKNN